MTSVTPISVREEIIDGHRVMVKVMHAGVAAYGGSPGLRIYNPGAELPASFNNAASLASSKLSAGRISGQGTLIARNMRAEGETDRRRRDIVAAYEADPTPECLHRIASEYKMATSTIARYCRKAGHRNVSYSSSAVSHGKGSAAETSKKTNAILDAISSAADRDDICPTNQALSIMSGYGETAVSSAIARLASLGRIAVERRASRG